MRIRTKLALGCTLLLALPLVAHAIGKAMSAAAETGTLLGSTAPPSPPSMTLPTMWVATLPSASATTGYR